MISVAAVSVFGLVSGFNDGGNLLASIVGARVVSPRVAVLLLLLVPVGPLLIGTSVAHTIGSSIIDLRGQGDGGFLAIVIVATGVVLLSWFSEVPTSMTLALVGAMVGWAISSPTHSAVQWNNVTRVLVGIPISVVIGGSLSFTLYGILHRAVGRLGHALVLRLSEAQIVTAALQAIAYGANDMEKTIGLAAVALALPPEPAGFTSLLSLLIAWAAFVLGSLLGGQRIIQRVGTGIVRVRPLPSLAQQLATAAIVSLLAALGVPVSTTQTIDGALVGVGLRWRASAVRWNIVRHMLVTWTLTFPLALAAGLGCHVLFRFGSHL